ncbi:MAG: acyl-CoA thioesterase [Elusimicrobia bacterium]|nr:acyl-CoA thioesterase [Elusimicrobiota bacterium]
MQDKKNTVFPSSEVPIQVQFYDTDSLGIIYYGSYYRYFEAGFLRFLKSRGLTFTEVHNQGIYLPATFSSCRYYAPSKVEQRLLVRTNLCKASRASIDFTHEVRNEDLDGRLVAAGETRHACVGSDWKVRALPDWLISKLTS